MRGNHPCPAPSCFSATSTPPLVACLSSIREQLRNSAQGRSVRPTWPTVSRCSGSSNVLHSPASPSLTASGPVVGSDHLPVRGFFRPVPEHPLRGRLFSCVPAAGWMPDILEPDLIFGLPLRRENAPLFSRHEKGNPIPFALLGHPVGHSLSPAMHNAAFKALGLHAHYSLIDVEPGDIPRTLEELRAKKFGGVNVTIPHKEAAYRFLAAKHALSDTAQLLHSVNTVVFRPDGSLLGDNTDAPGFLDALKEAFRASPRGKRILAARLRRRRPRPRPRLRHAGRRIHPRRRRQSRRAPPPAARPAPDRPRTPRRRHLPRPRPHRRARLRSDHPRHARRHAPRRSLAAAPRSVPQGPDSSSTSSTIPPSRPCSPPPRPPARAPPTASACSCTKAPAPSISGPAARRPSPSCAPPSKKP